MFFSNKKKLEKVETENKIYKELRKKIEQQ